MMKSRREIKALAREALREQRGKSILILLAVMLVVGVSVALDLTVFFTLGQGLVYWVVFWVGMLFIYVIGINADGELIKIFNREPARVGAVFSGLKVNFWRKLGGMLWMTLWVFLWMLLFFIPGIVKSLAYSMTPYILASCPNVTARQALKLSIRMTDGHKGELFVLGLSFIGWLYLGGLTLGILSIVFVGPYMAITYAGFFVELRDKALALGTITREELGWDSEETQSGVFEG